MLSGLSSFLFGNQRKDDDKKTPAPPSEAEDKSEWLLVNSSGDTVAIDTAQATEASLASSGASLLEDTLTDENLPLTNEQKYALTVDVSHHDHVLHCSSSTLSTPAKSDTSSSDDVSDFERYRGPYVSMRDLESHSDTGLSDVSSQPEHLANPSMDEEWLVTPPPCFTSPAGRRGSAATSVEKPATSDLENLLIEHPSMSVYYPSSSTGAGSRRQASPLSSVMSGSLRSNSTDMTGSRRSDSTDILTSDNDEFPFGGVEDNQEHRPVSPLEWRGVAEMPGLEIAQRGGGGVPRPIHHQPVIDLLAATAAGGTAVAVLEWKGKTRVERRVLSRSALDNSNRARTHDAQFKLRRQSQRAKGLPTSRNNKGKF